VTMPAYRESIDAKEVTITNAARQQLKALFSQVDDDDVEAVRIFVSGGGCSGMTYGMTFTDRCSELDRVLTDDGFIVYVDIVAMQYLKGVEIDYESRPLGDSFVFNNVFASTGGSGTCGGCGSAGG
jgi:iron-sulfur cluster insertion protein